MKQVTIISGKGGTGKTTLTAAFASLSKDAVFADCDVDAADLHLILKPEIKKTQGFRGMNIANIDLDICTKCGTCVQHCQFDAIDEEFSVRYESCEGCGVCAYICPVHAVTMKKRDSGIIYESMTRFGPFIHAQLFTAEEASGKLVTEVRNLAEDVASQKNKEMILIDGPPGIGCPVISAITGVDLVVVVTEPTLSGIHDLQRVIDVATHFNIPQAVIINKSDINPINTRDIEQYCLDNSIQVLGSIPYDTRVVKAMIEEKTITEYDTGDLSRIVTSIWERLLSLLR